MGSRSRRVDRAQGAHAHKARDGSYPWIGCGAISRLTSRPSRAPQHSIEAPLSAMMRRDADKSGAPLVDWVNVTGLLLGILVMYLTAFLVKF